MRRIPIVGLSVVVLTLALAPSVHSQFEPTGLPPVEQAAMADLVVVGKITGMEPQPVAVERRQGTARVHHLVATVRIEETLLGAKGVTHIRVGFVPEIRDTVNKQRPVFV